ncbi:hypothetical protein Hanom_Chr15g01408751 [Helianthus anomalus]
MQRVTNGSNELDWLKLGTHYENSPVWVHGLYLFNNRSNGLNTEKKIAKNVTGHTWVKKCWRSKVA